MLFANSTSVVFSILRATDNILYFSGYNPILPFLNYPKNLDLSYKTDLDLWDCLGRVKLIAKFHRTDLVICSHSREEKNLSYSRINTVDR